MSPLLTVKKIRQRWSCLDDNVQALLKCRDNMHFVWHPPPNPHPLPKVWMSEKLFYILLIWGDSFPDIWRPCLSLLFLILPSWYDFSVNSSLTFGPWECWYCHHTCVLAHARTSAHTRTHTHTYSFSLSHTQTHTNADKTPKQSCPPADSLSSSHLKKNKQTQNRKNKNTTNSPYKFNLFSDCLWCAVEI